MTKPDEIKERWVPCPPGTLSAFAGAERVRQRRKLLVRAVSILSAVMLATGAGWLVFRSARGNPEPTIGGIACSRVRELAPKFMMEQLDEAVTRQIRTHLEHCADCRRLLESMHPETAGHRPRSSLYGNCRCSKCRRDGLREILALVQPAP